MARTTNSDTLPFVESRYELGMLAAQRVRDLNGGAESVIDDRKDKPTVVALREIATGNVDMDVLRHEFVQSYKDSAPSIVETEEAPFLEVSSEDPALRDIDAELESVILEDATEDTTEQAEVAAE